MFNKIQKLLIENKISMTKLSREIGVSQGNISDWKSGRSKPKMEALRRITEYFKVPVSYFYKDTNDERTVQQNFTECNIHEVNGIKHVTAPEAEKQEQDENTKKINDLWKSLSDEGKRQLLKYAEFLSEQKK